MYLHASLTSQHLFPFDKQLQTRLVITLLCISCKQLNNQSRMVWFVLWLGLEPGQSQDSKTYCHSRKTVKERGNVNGFSLMGLKTWANYQTAQLHVLQPKESAK